MKKTVLFASLASSSLLFLSGCATPERYGNSATMFEQGQYGPARELFKDQKRNPETQFNAKGGNHHDAK